MKIFKFKNKLILQFLFVIIFFSTLQAKNLDKFNEGNYISDYLSGILLLKDNQFTTPHLWELIFAPSIIQKMIYNNLSNFLD